MGDPEPLGDQIVTAIGIGVEAGTVVGEKSASSRAPASGTESGPDEIGETRRLNLCERSRDWCGVAYAYLAESAGIFASCAASLFHSLWRGNGSFLGTGAVTIAITRAYPCGGSRRESDGRGYRAVRLANEVTT